MKKEIAILLKKTLNDLKINFFAKVIFFMTKARNLIFIFKKK